MTVDIAVLPGDGVGPEVTAAALSVLQGAAGAAGLALTTHEYPIGGCAIDETGTSLPDATLAACRDADAVLLGAVGGPKWDHLRGEQRCEQGLMRLRKGLEVFANVRPVRLHPRLVDRTPLQPGVVAGTDLVIVRELTGGAYFGEPRTRSGSGATETARDSIVYTAHEVARVARVAFELARTRRRHVVSVDKANVLITSQLWRDTVNAVASDFPDVRLEHRLVDSFAMDLIKRPTAIDVVVTENLFGDILSDEAAVLAGSLGMLPSASLNDSGRGLYEPVHGSAPDIAGKGIANPYGAILSTALLLRYSLRHDDLARAVEAAVDASIDARVFSADVGGTQSTEQIAAEVTRRVASHVEPSVAVAS
jgi:3-isopropylmalate dehydrogenase